MNNGVLLYNEIGPNGEEYKKGDWKLIAVHTEKEIKGFFGPYRFLSNTWPAKVILDGVEYSCVENAYKAWRWKRKSRTYFETCTPLEAIDYNRKNIPDGCSQDEWDRNKVEYMTFLNMQKYNKEQNLELYQKLKETGEKYLEETNWWGDEFWGKDKDGNGENNLGKVLMKVREEV